MIKVSKAEFYALIGPLERLDTGATMHHHPQKMLRWRARQWQNGDYKELAFTETLYDQPYPYPVNHYVDESLIEQLVVF